MELERVAPAAAAATRVHSARAAVVHAYLAHVTAYARDTRDARRSGFPDRPFVRSTDPRRG